MVTKGIITSIDFNGNTCQVRIPLFETAGNDPITGTAIVSNTPGSYNGYKVGDVVLVAFEDGKMQNPVIVGKLYLGAAKEKQDPRGTINVETTTASKSASLPADAVLTANVDSNVPNTNTPFGSLASIANNLNSLNTDVNQLDRFTRNQFNSVITDVNDQGEQLRSEIKQTAENIENKVVHKHKDGSQKALGWDLNDTEWKINAQDTVTDENGETKVKDINIVTIDRSGMSIAGDLKLNGYPKNIIVKYAQNDSDTTHPALDSTKWSTNVPARVDGKYIWQWNHTEIYSFDKNSNSWNEQDDDKIVCITGAKGETGKEGAPGKNGADGKDGYNTVTVMLYKRSKTSISGKQIDVDLYYKFSDQKLYTDDTCATEYTLPTGWSYTISGTGDSSNGDLYCIAAVAHSNTESDEILHSEWAGPTLYVENGTDGKPGDSVYTISIDNDFDSVPADVNGNVSNSYMWESETKHNVRVYYGKEAQDFTVIDQSGTAPSTGLCIKYELTNVTLGNTPSVSNKVATAWINSLSTDTDTGNILYTLYVDGVETGITGKFSATKIKSPAPTYTISIDNDFATIPTSTVNAKIYRKTSQKFKPIDNGYTRETITIAGATKKLPGMRLSAVNNTTNLNTALLWKPDEVIKIAADITKSYVEDITKHNVTVYCNDAVETITADNFIVKLDSDGLDANMDETQNYLVCELGGFDSTGARATDFPGMKPVVKNNVVTNYITALSALGDTSESKNVYIQYTYYAKGKPVATAKFEVTRHTGPTTYYLSSNVSTIKVNKNVSPATITPDTVTCTAYSLDTSTNTNTRFTNGAWKYKWDNGAWSPTTSTASDLEISTAEVVTKGYKQLYIELYLGNQLWDRETIDVIADGENAVDYNILVDNGQIKRDPNDHTEDTSSITFSFYKWNGSTRSNFNGAHFNYYIDGVGPDHRQCDSNTNTFTVNADSNPAISSVTKNIKVELLDKQNGTVVESETIDVVVNGSNGLYITNTKQWYKLFAEDVENPAKPTTDIVKLDENGNPTHTTDEGWSDIPLDAINDMNLWTSLESIFSDDTSEKKNIKFSDPVKDAAFALAQGKSTNYYSPTEPINNIKEGDCWFDTGYVKIDPNPDKRTEYLGKFVLHSDQDQDVAVDDKDKIYVQGIEPDTNGTFKRFIPSESTTSQLYMVKVTPDNIDKKGLFTVKTDSTAGTPAYETGNLKQWNGAKWEDIAGELVTNKLTANYINAMDITAKKLLVKNDNKETLLDAGWTNDNIVTIGGFDITNNSICSTDEYENADGKIYKKPVVYIGMSDTTDAYKVGTLSTKNWRLLIGNKFGVTNEGKLVVQEGTFSGSLAASGGSITNMTTIQGDSVECSKLSLTNNCVISTTALVDDKATATKAVDFTFNKNKRDEDGDWDSGYIGGDSYYSLTIHASRQLAESKNIGTLVSVTLEVESKSSGGSGAGTTARKIYFNKPIIFPANVLQTNICITGATFGTPGTVHKIKELTFDKDTHFSSSDGITYKQTVDCLTPLEKYIYSSEFSSSIVPKNTDLNLGASSRSWNEVYATDVYATYFYGTSDRRLKKNIKDYKPKNSILDLPVVEFDFKDSGKHQIGCIAQDLQKLFPELVETRDDGYLTIEENKLVYLLLLEIKKLNQRINILETNLSNMTSNKELK